MLIDSELLAVRVDIACLAEEGIAISAEEIIERYVGVSLTGMLADLERRFDCKLGDDFRRCHQLRLNALFEAELQPMPGIAAVLDRLCGKVCVASSSSPERLRHALGLVNLYDRFHPHIFSTNMVAHGKPAPDLFLYAAVQMGVAPVRCIVVEDSLAGVEAAVAAGMTALGFTGGSHCGPLHAARLQAQGAAAVVATMAALPPALAELSPRLR